MTIHDFQRSKWKDLNCWKRCKTRLVSGEWLKQNRDLNPGNDSKVISCGDGYKWGYREEWYYFCGSQRDCETVST